MQTVLLVDSDREKRQTLRFALECGGYRVCEAARAADALTLVRGSQEPLVVLLAQWINPAESERLLAAVTDDSSSLGRNHWLLLATCPRHIAPPLAALIERLDMPVVRSPFDVARLLSAIAAVAPAGATSG